MEAKIIVVGADTLWSSEMRVALSDLPGWICMGYPPTWTEGEAVCERYRPALIVIELPLPDEDGFDVAERLRAMDYAPKILLMTRLATQAMLVRASLLKHAGFILRREKDQFCDELKMAVSAMGRGEAYCAREVREAFRKLRQDPLAFMKVLSDTELSLLPYFSIGESDLEIARRKNMAALTVKYHRHRILRKLGLESTPRLMRWALERGFCGLRPAPSCIRPW